MARDDLGVRVERLATKKVLDGMPTTEGNFVGWANRSLPLGAFVDPNNTTATQQIQIGELFVMMVGGKHEVPIGATTGDAPVGTVVDDLLYISKVNNAISRNAAPAGTDEVQKVIVKAKKGKFTLEFDDAKTGEIKFNATALEVQEALEKLVNIEPGDVSVTGGPGSESGVAPYVVTFGGQYADENVPQLVGTNVSLEEPGAIEVKTEPAGAAGPAYLPLGVVEEIDTVREVALVNTNALAAFFAA